MEDRKELAKLIAETLKAAGFDTWATPGGINIRTNATLKQTRAALEEVDYPHHLIGHNTAYSKSGTGEFKTLVKTA